MAPVDEAPREFEFVIDGEVIVVEDLTFKEQSEYREAIRELSGDPNASIYVAEPMDRWPALAWVIKKRSNPDFTLEEACELKAADVLQPVAAKRPTRARKRS